jgi:hypothetical protein
MKNSPGRVKEVLQQVSGQAIEVKLDEYSAVYGEVLLGMHREIASLRVALDSQKGETEQRLQQVCEVSYAARATALEVEQRLATMESLVSTLQRMEADAKSGPRMARQAYRLSLVAVVLAALALTVGGASWILL